MIWPAFRFFRPARADRCELIPLGTYCQSAAALRTIGLRGWAGPFDWLHSTPEMIADCIDDDFVELLNTKNMRSVPLRDVAAGSKRQCRHLVFEPKYRLPPLFNHHDPASDRNDLLKLTRSADRLRCALRAPHDKTFVMMTMYERSERDVGRLLGVLRSRARSNKLIVITTKIAAERSWAVTRKSAELVWADLAVTSASTGVRFANPDDDKFLNEILLSLARPGALQALTASAEAPVVLSD